ncbi:MAG: hypothetical protein OEY24_00930 [Candidatus Bathyarchaeota archaeon]|nr:hypothetical protein [Candidatus Bathyarchaeota archaeon]MDH5494258.1 hypothetical protein [Candidatus Bathyarchaeota archaeon]
MDSKSLLGTIVVIILFFFGTVFALASAYAPMRLAVAAILFIAGFGVIAILYIIGKKPSEIIQRVELSGEMKAVPIKCPNCGASIQPDKIKIVEGVPYATCSYCGNTVEVAEEPKW